MQDQLVLRVITKFILPYILMYAFYVQLHGEFSPGGGFQAGVIFASAFILYGLIYGSRHALKVFPMSWMQTGAALGVLLYAGVGLTAQAMGGNFLGYSILAEEGASGQKLGILLIELGVGITVACVMMVVFFTFAGLKR